MFLIMCGALKRKRLLKLHNGRISDPNVVIARSSDGITTEEELSRKLMFLSGSQPFMPNTLIL